MTQPARPSGLPEGRYGTPSPTRRRITIAAVTVLALVSLSWLAWAAWFHSTPKVRSELQSYEVVTAHQADATVRVALRGDPVEDRVRCLIRASSADHTPVGELSFVPVEGRNEVSIRTERQATSVELIGCTAKGQARHR